MIDVRISLRSSKTEVLSSRGQAAAEAGEAKSRRRKSQFCAIGPDAWPALAFAQLISLSAMKFFPVVQRRSLVLLGFCPGGWSWLDKWLGGCINQSRLQRDNICQIFCLKLSLYSNLYTSAVWLSSHLVQLPCHAGGAQVLYNTKHMVQLAQLL